MDCNDYELVSLAKEGNEDAINILYEKYKPIIISKSRYIISKTCYLGIEINDIMQEGFIGLEEAINNFSELNNVSFYTFASMCIDREIINYVRKNRKKKSRLLNEAILIDDYVEKQVKDDFDMELFYIVKEKEEYFKELIDKKLTNFEKEVFELKYNGYNYEDIAHNLNKDVKAIYNTVNRIKNKIKFIIEED